jgi:hypothetical protein
VSVHLEVPGIDAHHVEHVIDQRSQRAHALGDQIERSELLGVGRTKPVRAQQLQVRLDHTDRRTEVVRDARHEVAAHPVHLAQLRRRVALAFDHTAKRVLALLALGQVAGHLGEPPLGAVAPYEPGDDDAGPEPGAVLAHPPPFVGPPALRTGLTDRAVRYTGKAILLGVEGGEVPADDLVRPVALQSFRPGVPAGDDAVGVEHEDRIVHDARDQELEQAGALGVRHAVDRASTRVRSHVPHRGSRRTHSCVCLARAPRSSSARGGSGSVQAFGARFVVDQAALDPAGPLNAQARKEVVRAVVSGGVDPAASAASVEGLRSSELASGELEASLRAVAEATATIFAADGGGLMLVDDQQALRHCSPEGSTRSWTS